MKNEESDMQNFGQSEHGEVVIYQSSDGFASLDVHLAEETVWLTQAQMAELFDRNKRTISEHLRNVFKESELEEEVVVRKFRTTTAGREPKVIRDHSAANPCVLRSKNAGMSLIFSDFPGNYWKVFEKPAEEGRQRVGYKM